MLMNILYVELVKIFERLIIGDYLIGGPVVRKCLDNNARECENIDIYLSIYYLFI